jgi:hypothetical protein
VSDFAVAPTPAVWGCKRRSTGLLVVVFLIFVGNVAPARAQEAELPVIIETVPHVEGVSFTFAGERIVSDEGGVAHARVAAPGTYRLRVGKFQVIDENVRLEFSQWSTGAERPVLEVVVDGATRTRAAFDVDYLVTTRFTDARSGDLDPPIVESVNVVNDSDEVTTYRGQEPGLAGPTAVWWERHPPGTRWLRGVRAVGSDTSLDTELVSYRADSVVVNDTRFPTSSELYYPARGPQWDIEVMAYPVEFYPRGLVSRLGVGSTVHVTYPDGESRDHRAERGRAVLLPRGSYEARPDVRGFSLSTNFTVPSSDEVRVVAVTYVDVAAAALLFGIVVLVMERLRQRRSQTGDRSTVAPARVAPERAVQPTAEAAVVAERAGDDSHVETSYVRAYLRDGRSVEGWSRRWADSHIWFMDVTIVRNGEGDEIPSTARDTVLLSSHIERVDKLEAEPPTSR